MRQRTGKRRGLGRLEVVLVLILAFVFLGLLVTLLVRGREAADRVQCANNLRRMGAALHKFAETTGTLPPAPSVRATPPGQS